MLYLFTPNFNFLLYGFVVRRKILLKIDIDDDVIELPQVFLCPSAMALPGLKNVVRDVSRSRMLDPAKRLFLQRGRIWSRESGDLYYKQTQHKGGTKMESIVMFDIKELAKEVGFRKMLREIGTYKDLDEKVEAELDQLRRMEENDDFLLEEGEEMPEE